MNRNGHHWAARPRIYVENDPSRDEAYAITAALLEARLSALSQGRVTAQQISVGISETRDPEAFAAAEVLITFRPDRAAIAGMGGLKLLQATSAGVDAYLPLDFLPEGAMLCNASGVHAEKVRDFGAMAVLMLHEHVPARIAAQQRHDWSRTLRPTSRGKRVLVYGAGALGGAVADGLSGFGFHVIGIGRTNAGARPGFSAMHTPEDLEALLPETDYLVISAPLTAATRGRFGERELRLLPRGAGVLNIARGQLLDQEAVARLLAEGHLSGAVLDVFEQEPLPQDSALWETPGLMVFPHVSADSPADYARNCADALARNLVALLEGKLPPSLVDPVQGY